MIRSFLALKLSLSTVENLGALQKDLRRRCEDADIAVRWVPLPNVHLTLRFLGQITEPMSHAVKDMLAPIVTRRDAFDLEIADIGAFPDTGPPLVIWVGLGQGEALVKDLYSSICERLLAAGFNFEDKPFRPHITLGRVKRAPENGLGAILDGAAPSAFGTSAIRHLFCYQSELMAQGVEYTAQWVLPFKNVAPKRQTQATPVGEPSPQTGEGTTEEVPGNVAENQNGD